VNRPGSKRQHALQTCNTTDGVNTVPAPAYDPKVFFAAVAKPPDEIRSADVLAFIIAQRAAYQVRHMHTSWLVNQGVELERPSTSLTTATSRRGR
jgi:hypothetical protein